MIKVVVVPTCGQSIYMFDASFLIGEGEDLFDTARALLSDKGITYGMLVDLGDISPQGDSARVILAKQCICKDQYILFPNDQFISELEDTLTITAYLRVRGHYESIR